MESDLSTPSKRHGKFKSVVPWRNPEQFIKVYKHLYSKSISDKRWAVDQISVWETRCHPSLPTAIEATSVIIGAVIQDMLYEAEKTFCQEKDIQMLYAMSLVRFVNLMVEIDQNAQCKIKMSVLADKRNIPSWIVELRHEATHAFLPSLPILRMGVESALQYLEESFWKVEAANISPILMTPTELQTSIVNLITQFRNIQLCRAEKKGTKSELKKDLIIIIKEIRSLLKIHRHKFIETFVQPGVFITAEDLIRLLKTTGIVFIEEEDDLSLPSNLEEFWLPVFRMIHKYDLIPYFLEMLLLSQEKYKNRICQKAAAAWVNHILLSTLPRFVSRLATCFKFKGVQLNFHRLLYATMKGINNFTLNIFPLLIKRIGQKEKYTHLYCLVALYHGIVLNKTSGGQPAKRPREKDPEIVFTVDDLEEDLNEEKMKRKKSRKDPNIWSLAPVTMNFSQVPLGEVSGPEPEEEEQQSKEREDVDADDEERFIFGNKDDESTAEVKFTPDVNAFLGFTEINSMIYRRKEKHTTVINTSSREA